MTLILAIAALGPALGSEGRNLYVDPTRGDDRNNGLAAQPDGANGPFKTIARGIRLARPGDTVHLTPVTYFESAVFHNRDGEPGRPITLDGHGATLEAAELLRPEDWQQVGPGLYRNDHLIRTDWLTQDDAIYRRWFFLFDGRIVHMGRTMKGPNLPLKRPDALKPGEWTYIPAEHAFFVRIEPGQSLADARIAAPQRSASVAVSGKCTHLVIRNVIGKHPWNDGYNIHGVTRDVVFENISAIECGDDGFSAHDDCTFVVNGFTSIGNSTGIANAGRSCSVNRRVWIQDCLGIDVLILDEGYRGGDDTPKQARHALIDSVIVSSASRAIVVDGARTVGGPCRLELDNVRFQRAGPPGEISLSKNSVLTANRVTFLGLNLIARGGAVELARSVIGGSPAPEFTLRDGAAWKADHNRYDLRGLRLDHTTYTAATLAEFRKASGQDAHSRWEPFEIVEGTPRGIEAGVGVDAARLPTH